MAEIQNVYIIRVEDVFIHTSNNPFSSELFKNTAAVISQINPYQKYIESILGKHDHKTVLQALRCFKMRYCYFINKIFFIDFFNFIHNTKNKLVFVSKDFLIKESIHSFLHYHGVNPHLNFDLLRYNKESIINIAEEYRGLRWNKYVTVIDNDLKPVLELRKREFNAFYAENSNDCNCEGKKYIKFLSKHRYTLDTAINV